MSPPNTEKPATQTQHREVLHPEIAHHGLHDGFASDHLESAAELERAQKKIPASRRGFPLLVFKNRKRPKHTPLF